MRIMKKKEIKEFVQEHKKQLCIGAGIVIGGVSMYLLGRSSVGNWDDYAKKVIKTIDKGDENAKNFLNYIKTSGDLMRGSTHYAAIDADIYRKLAGTDTFIGEDGIVAKVYGAIIFDTPVGTITEF